MYQTEHFWLQVTEAQFKLAVPVRVLLQKRKPILADLIRKEFYYRIPGRRRIKMVEEQDVALTFSHKHIKNPHIYMENDSHGTSTERWQKNLNLQKGQETLHITG